MGSAQSVPSEAAVHRNLVERLNALQVKESLKQQEVEKGYVHIDMDLRKHHHASRTSSIHPVTDPINSTSIFLRFADNLHLNHRTVGKGTIGGSQGQDSASRSHGAGKPNLDGRLQNKLALSALISNPVTSIVSQKTATLADAQLFNIKIPFEGAPVTNQRSSGRCWLFASTNVFRVAIMKKHNLSEFELSQKWLFYWDKLEKANYFLEMIMDTADEELDGRLVQELLKAPVNDGGQWDMVANLVTKYGLVSSGVHA